MRSVFVDSTLTRPPFGGATTFLVEVCAALTARGDHVTVVAEPGPDLSVVRRLQAAGVEVRQDIWRAVDLPEEQANRLASWLNMERADAYVISISPDAGWLALPLLDPSIVTVSISHADGPAFYEPLKHYAPFIDCAVGVSNAIYRKIISECALPRERACHVPYGVMSLSSAEINERREQRFESPGPLRVGYLGRLIQALKRAMDLVPLTKELKRRNIPFELHVIGDGPERHALEKGFEETDAVRNVKVWGWLSPDAVRERLRELDVVVLLSDSEGLPLALLESMGHGVVPVVTNLDGGLTEVVKENQNGFVVGVGDIPAFVNRLELLAGDRGRLAQMRQAAWETSLNYSIETMVERYVQIFQQAAKASGRRVGLTRQYPVMPSCKSSYPVWMRKLKRRFLTNVSAMVYLSIVAAALLNS